MKQKGLAPILIILLIAAATFGYLIYSGKINLNQTTTQVSQPSPTPDETANWKTYTGETLYTTDGSSLFTIKYPAEWLLEGNILYPFGKKDLAYKIVLGAGGHGGPGPQETKTFPGGSAKYYWNKNEFAAGGYASFAADNKNVYIFEVTVPKDKEVEYQKIFDQMLATFKFQ